MSRKHNNSRLAKKQVRKDRRKTKRSLKSMQHAGKMSTGAFGTRNKEVVADGTNDNYGSPTDERPTTSHHGKTQISPKKNFKKQSPWKNRGGKVNRFNKIKDDQARKLVRRSVLIMSDNQTPKKYAQHGKGVKRLINNNKKFSQNKFSSNNKSRNKISPRTLKNQKKFTHKNVTSTLEEGEIRSEDERTLAKTKKAESGDESENKSGDESDEDDCIVIEPTVHKIVIEDEDDDEDEDEKDDEEPSTSVLSTSYQSLIKSFNQRTTSTPCQKNSTKLYNQQPPSSPSYASVVKKPESPNNDKSKETPMFFEDVNGRPWFETINSTDHFADYTKLSTLRENPVLKRRSIRLKHKTDEVIDLEDSNVDGGETTLKPNKLKRKSGDLDDSVIFISETNTKDFIPIIDVNNPSAKIFKVRDESSTPPNKVRINNNMYTKSETKQLNAYNENAYNPSAGEELTSGKRMVIIDGSNVAFKHSLDKFFSVKGLKIAIEYFEKLGHEVKAVIPQFRMNKNKSSDYEELDRLHKAGKIVQTPCKNLPGLTSTSYDDRFVLQLAFELDAAIVSNDNYRDLLHENPSFKKMIENRVIGYTWCNDIFILPKDPYGKWGPTLHKILNRS